MRIAGSSVWSIARLPEIPVTAEVIMVEYRAFCTTQDSKLAYKILDMNLRLTCDSEEAIRISGDYVIPAGRLRALGIWVQSQGPNPGPCAQDIRPPDIHCQILLDSIQDELHLILMSLGLVSDMRLAVCTHTISSVRYYIFWNKPWSLLSYHPLCADQGCKSYLTFTQILKGRMTFNCHMFFSNAVVSYSCWVMVVWTAETPYKRQIHISPPISRTQRSLNGAKVFPQNCSCPEAAWCAQFRWIHNPQKWACWLYIGHQHKLSALAYIYCHAPRRQCLVWKSQTDLQRGFACLPQNSLLKCAFFPCKCCKKGTSCSH